VRPRGFAGRLDIESIERTLSYELEDDISIRELGAGISVRELGPSAR